MKVKQALLALTLGMFAAVSIPAYSPVFAADAPAAAIAETDKAILPDKAWNCLMPEGIPKPEAGKLLFEVDLKIANTYKVGKTQFGDRVAYVIDGGDIKSEKFNGTVLNLGLEYDLTLSNGVVEIEQIIIIKASDGKYIHARSGGTGLSDKDARIVMDFEAPNGSSSEWLGKGKFVARRKVDAANKVIKLSVYDVADVKVDPADAVKIVKPQGVPSQSWDYRKPEAGEKQGEQVIVENVTLAGSQQTGMTKRGNRNIIPISGGTIKGMLNGKVVPGGADYQNLSGAATIDARYMWETDDGEIIIIRNAGPMNALIPTFEAKVDGKYAWLNSGTYKSSAPGMGAGGVSLTFYKTTK